MHTREYKIDIFGAILKYYWDESVDGVVHPLGKDIVPRKLFTQKLVSIIKEYERVHHTDVCINLDTICTSFVQTDLNAPSISQALRSILKKDYYVVFTIEGRDPHVLIHKDSPMLYLFNRRTPVTNRHQVV